MLGKASKSENLLKNRSAVGCCGFFARNGGGADVADWGAGVDKIRSFCFVFVYFEVRAGAFGERE